MTIRFYLRFLASFLLIVAIQVLAFRNLSLFYIGYGFPYLLALVALPPQFKGIPTLLWAFFVGFVIDMFYDSLGLHIMACVTAGFIRHIVVSSIAPPAGYEDNSQSSTTSMGFGWYLSYTVPIILVHHFTLFVLEDPEISSIGLWSIKAIVSTGFSLVLTWAFQNVLFKFENNVISS